MRERRKGRRKETCYWWLGKHARQKERERVEKAEITKVVGGQDRPVWRGGGKHAIQGVVSP